MFRGISRVFSWSAAAVASLALVAANAFADAPGRVARLAEYAGDVRVASQADGWQPAYRNNVITAGDNLWVSDGGRAELDVGPLQVWLSGGANIYFERFDDQNLVARLASGIIAVRIRQWEPRDAMRVATEHGEVSFTQPGLYFVTAGNRSFPSVVATRFGQAELNTFGRINAVNRDETFAFDQGGTRFDRFAYAGVASGGFESWVVARDRRIERWESRNRGYFNPWMVGVRDLDDHGYWESNYEYGRVWYPNTVSSNWAPYRYGRWSWVQPWGWTWVDDAPWGFAPFHYGRWVRVGGRWAWCPGSYVGRAVYAPALVTFYGGNGWSVNASVGPTYSWVPLGWNEPYVPWYTYSPNYWRTVNRPYVRNSAEDPWRPPAYVHASVPGAITTIAAAGLISGRPVAQNYIRNVPTPDLRAAPPARMGEVIPQVRGARFDPNPVAPRAGVSEVAPPVRGSPPAGAVTESAPGRAQPFPQVRERAAAPIQPNVNVAQPRVWQDPNPIAPQRVEAPIRGTERGLERGVPVREPATREPGMREPLSPPPVREGATSAPPSPRERNAPEPRELREPRNVAPSAAPGGPGVRAPIEERSAPPENKGRAPAPGPGPQSSVAPPAVERAPRALVAPRADTVASDQRAEQARERQALRAQQRERETAIRVAQRNSAAEEAKVVRAVREKERRVEVRESEPRPRLKEKAHANQDTQRENIKKREPL